MGKKKASHHKPGKNNRRKRLEEIDLPLEDLVIRNSQDLTDAIERYYSESRKTKKERYVRMTGDHDAEKMRRSFERRVDGGEIVCRVEISVSFR